MQLLTQGGGGSEFFCGTSVVFSININSVNLLLPPINCKWYLKSALQTLRNTM